MQSLHNTVLKLQDLDIENCAKINELKFLSFINSTNLENLNSLCVDNFSINSIHSILQNKPKLTSLKNLHDSSLSSYDYRKYDINYFTNLKLLKLELSHLHPNFLQNLSDSIIFTCLKSLSIQNSNITPDFYKKLITFNSESLLSLDISYTNSNFNQLYNIFLIIIIVIYI